MLDEKNRQQRNSVLGFLITLLILLLLVLGVWLIEQVAHRYKAASADAEVDVENVSEPDDLKIAARKLPNRTGPEMPKDMALAKDTIAHHDAIESSLREENKKPKQEKAQTPIPKSSSEPPPNPENEQGNLDTQETEESLLSDPLQQSANTVGKAQAGENLPKLLIRLTSQTIQSLIESDKARLLVVIDDGNGPRQYWLKGDTLEALEVAELTEEVRSGFLLSRHLLINDIDKFPSALVDYKIRAQGGPGSTYKITLHFSRVLDARLAARQRAALAEAGIHANKAGVATIFRLDTAQNRPVLIDIKVK